MKRSYCLGFILWAVMLTGGVWAQAPQQPLTLEESIQMALDQNLTVHSAMVGVKGSKYNQMAAFTNFLPLLTGHGSFNKTSSPSYITTNEATRHYYNLNATVTQPVFTGGYNLASYRSAILGVDLSKASLDMSKQDTVLAVREGYFNILRAEKFLDVAQQTVKQFEAQLEVTKAFFDVGIVAKNDVLQAEVRLANARQALVKAENDLFSTKASFNTLLRRDIHMPFEIVDILEYKPFPMEFETSLQEALKQRPEIKTAKYNVEQAKEGVRMVRSEFFPTISLNGSYNRLSDPYQPYQDLHSDSWSIQALATITLWNWGSTAFKVGESKVKVTQAEDAKQALIDAITLEVKNDYLNLAVAEKNIGVSEVAIAQAEENLRINEERYKNQVATQTDVLDAVVLLAQARVNYYSALSDFNIAKALLERAMGKMYP